MSSNNYSNEISQKQGQKFQNYEIIKQNELIQNEILQEFGSYISRNLKGGRAVKVIDFGLFTFCYPEVTLPGVTEQQIHDKNQKQPIFQIIRDFVKGIELQSGLITDQGIRPISFYGLTGQIQTQQINYFEIASQINTSKEVVKNALQSIFRNLGDEIRKGLPINFNIPQVGRFIHKNGIVCIQFEQYLKQQIKNIFSQSLQQKIQIRSRSTLTRSKLNQLQNNHSLSILPSLNTTMYQNNKQNLEFDSNQSGSQGGVTSNASSWLKKKLGVNISQNFGRYSEFSNKKSILTETSQNKSRFSYQTSDSFFTPGDLLYKSFVRYLMDNNINSVQFQEAIKNSQQKQSLTIEQIQQFKIGKAQFVQILEHIGYQIPLNKYDLLFRSIDKQNQGQITYQDLCGLCEKQNQLEKIKDVAVNVQRQDLDIKNIINLIKSEFQVEKPGTALNERILDSIVQQVNIKNQSQLNLVKKMIQLVQDKSINKSESYSFSLLNNLQNKSQNQQNWLYNIHAKLITQLKAANQDISNLDKKIRNLKIHQEQKSKKDSNTQQLISCNEIKSNNSEKFHKTGINDYCTYKILKKVLQQYLNNLSNSDLNRYLSLLPQCVKENISLINLNQFYEQLQSVLGQQFDYNFKPLKNLAHQLGNYMKDHNFTTHEFINRVFKIVNENKMEANSDNNRIQTQQFAKYLYKYIFQDISPSYLDQLVVVVDVDKDGYIDKYDVDAFLTKYVVLSQGIQGDNQNQQDFEQFKQYGTLTYQQKMALIKQQQEIQKLGQTPKQLNDELQKLIKIKKLSHYELFVILDQNNDGIITRDEFINNLEKAIIIDWDFNIKNKYYNAMDIQNIGIVDYQRFLDMMNNNHITKNCNDSFDWQLKAVKQMQQFFLNEHVTPIDAFKLVDMDFDGVISKKDLKLFLLNVLRFPEFDLSDNNINRLYKLLDKYKRELVLQSEFTDLIFNSNSGKINDLNNSLNNVNSTQITQQPPQLSTKNHSQLTNSNQIQTQSQFSLSESLNKQLVNSFNLNEITNTLSSPQNDEFILDWKYNAKHQIGYYIIKKFKNDIKGSYENITNMGPKLLFAVFKEWITHNGVLKGLELSNNLLQQLFADLDPHKKGYLSEQDWLNVFGNINLNELTQQEIKQVLNQHFPTPYEAFKTFRNQKGYENKQSSQKLDRFEQSKQSLNTVIQDLKIDFLQFFKSIQLQLPNRFSKKELENYWKSITQHNKGTLYDNFLTYRQFMQIFYKHHTYQMFSQQNNKIQSSSSQISHGGILQLENNSQSKKKYPVMNYLKKIQYSDSQVDTVNVLEKLKSLLRSSDTPNLLQHFEKFDKLKKGYLTNLDFRLAIRDLHLSLSQTDLDQCLVIAKTHQGGYVDYYDFIKKITPGDIQALIIQRAKGHIQKIREDIYCYMLSPKDAFRQFSKNGQMTIQEFNSFMNKLSLLKQQNVPAYSIMKDVFEFIDIRKDGVIDLHEWMESFRKLDSTNIHQKTNQNDENNNDQKQVLNSNLQLNYNFDIKAFDWECTKDFDHALKLIGKNRKPLLKEFQQKQQEKGQNLSFTDAKNILQKFLSQYIQLSENNYDSLIRFAEKKGFVDYQYMFNVYKSRLVSIIGQPCRNQEISVNS